MSKDQRVAVVTGSNKGIGYGIVQGLCKKFDGIVYLTARDENRGIAAVQKLNELGLEPEFHQLDVTDKESVNTFAEFIKNKHGGLDVLVNNAGIAFSRNSSVPFDRQAEESIAVNYFGLLNVCHALFPLLRPHARVVNVSSSMGHLLKIPSKKLQDSFSSPNVTEKEITDLMQQFVKSAKRGDHVKDWGESAYCVSKVGVSAVSFVQQREFDQDPREDIVVNSVHPGYVDTDMTSHNGVLTIEEGAYAPILLSLLPPGVTSLRGQYVWRDGIAVSWLEPLKEHY
uniref:carbonyl reductase (NADPH) n=1 Tax=Clastoptera arizonana TaxID=38151 RepID=A0A1B6C7K7_9HEMI